MNLFQNTSFHSDILGTRCSARMLGTAAMIASAVSFLRGSEATRCSTVACEMRGDTIFQFWMPSVSASSALQASAGCLVLAEITVLAVQEYVVSFFVVGFAGT